MAKIVLAGGSGFMGKILAVHFAGKGDKVIVLTRGGDKIENGIKYVNWDSANIGRWAMELEGSDVLVNLTGKSVNCRYNEKNKSEIFSSRLKATRALGHALKAIKSPPPLWINAASATIYRHAEDHPQDEYTGETGTGFSVEVCKQWEAAFFEQKIPGVRQIALRTAIVLGKNGGVMPYYFNLAKFGLGGRQCNGRQYFSWIYEDDVIGIVEFLITHDQLAGVFNASSPCPVQNAALMNALRHEMRVPFGIPAPKYMLKAGAWLLGTETELILKSRWVLPARLTDAGYRFKVTNIKRAIHLCCRV
jgi:uncharacterized protein (TIGR01777 family)